MRNRTIRIMLLQATIAFCLGQAKSPDLLTILPEIVEFDPTGVGQSSGFVTPPVLNNYRTQSVTLTGFSLAGPNAADFTVAAGACPLSPASLASGAHCSPALTFTPSAAGLRTATVVVQDTGGAPQYILLTGQGVPATKKVAFQPAVLAFGDTPTGLPIQNAPTGIAQVTNIGSAPVNISSVAITGADAGDFHVITDGCSSQSEPVGSSCPVTIAFAPVGVGGRHALLEVSGDAAGGKQSLPLSGVASGPENLLQVIPAVVSFDPLNVAANESAPVILSNAGSQPITVTNFQVTGANAADFTLSNNCQPLPFTLAIQGQCQIQVQFAPASLGVRSAALVITSSADSGPQSVALEGSGLKPTAHLSFSTSPVSSGVLTVGATGQAKTILVNEGPGNAPLSLAIEGSIAANFTMSDTCSSTLVPDAACPITIDFTPFATGIYTANLVATDTQTGETQSAVLIGSGQPAGSVLSVGTSSFLGERVGHVSNIASFTLTNTSESSLTLGDLTLSGAAQSDFSIFAGNCSAGIILQPNASCSIGLTCTPSTLGPRLGELDVSYSGATSPVAIPLAGMGISGGKIIDLGGVSVTLGPQPVGALSIANIGISNTGDEPVSIQSITLTGPQRADYTILDNSCVTSEFSLGAGESCNLSIQFQPSATGPRIAYVQVTDDASGSPQSVVLAGFGTTFAPPLAISAYPPSYGSNPVDFGGLPLGSSTGSTIFMSSSSYVQLQFSGIKLVGRNAADFTLSPPSGCVGYYSDCYFTVNFTPSATGLRTAELQVTDDAAGSPQIIPLAGFGLKSKLSVALIPVPLAFTQPVAPGTTVTETVTVTNSGTEGLLESTEFPLLCPDDNVLIWPR